MSNDKQTIYAGNGRQVTSKYGTFRSVSICLTDLPKEHMTKGNNGKTYIKLNVNDKDQKDQFGNDVFVTVDTWKPDPNYSNQKQESKAPNIEISLQQEEMDDLPF